MLRSHGVQRPGMQMASNAARRLEQVARTLTTNAAAGATSRSRGSQLLKENLQRQVCHGPTRPTGEARTPRANPRGPTCPVCGPRFCSSPTLRRPARSRYRAALCRPDQLLVPILLTDATQTLRRRVLAAGARDHVAAKLEHLRGGSHAACAQLLRQQLPGPGRRPSHRRGGQACARRAREWPQLCPVHLRHAGHP